MHSWLRVRQSSVFLRHSRCDQISVFGKLSIRPELSQTRHVKSRKIIRSFSLASVPAVLLPPVVFGGLLITLWTYKCLMMIIFQNKIIYQPSLPPFSRSEKLADYINECKPVSWTDHAIQSLDGTKLRLLEGVVADSGREHEQRHVIVVYFQGNGSSLPPRLPYISNIVKQLHAQSNARYTFVALSYRGFWTSSGRASQKGIELDAQAALAWVSRRYEHGKNTHVVIYGQSIGAGVATTAAATWLTKQQSEGVTHRMSIAGLLLETPFTSLREMLISLYPQKFLPYRYLGPFLMSTWDSRAAFRSVGRAMDNTVNVRGLVQAADIIKVLLLEAGSDELVPAGNAELLLQACQPSRHIQAEHKVVRGALHTNVMMKSTGKKEIVEFLKSFE